MGCETYSNRALFSSSTSFANDAKTAGPALAAIQKQLSKTLVVGVDNDQNMLKAYNLNTTDGVTAIPDGNVTQIVKNLSMLTNLEPVTPSC